MADAINSVGLLGMALGKGAGTGGAGLNVPVTPPPPPGGPPNLSTVASSQPMAPKIRKSGFSSTILGGSNSSPALTARKTLLGQ